MPQNCPGGVGVRWEEVEVEEDRGSGQGSCAVWHAMQCTCQMGDEVVGEASRGEEGKDEMQDFSSRW